MPDIVISEFMDEAAVDRLREKFDTLYAPGLVDDPSALEQAVRSARALIVRNRTQVRSPLLDAGVGLEVIGRLGVGLDNIDTAICAARGIDVIPATGANNVSVAEYVITAALVLLRGAWLRSDEVAAGTWPRQAMMGRELGGKVMGLVGYGAIARETAARARCMGMTVIAHDPHLSESDPAWDGVRSAALSEVFEQADVLSLHVPLTAQTRALVNGERLAQMKPGSIVVNAARGGVVDEAALAAALRAGQSGGAALDVFDIEPLTADSGALFEGLNVLLTPHIAGVTEESNVRVSAMIADAVATRLA
ncbi:MAG: hydroxyacid dehydrogenase [Pseudomonadota bacterium]